ncbi:MAG: hypothetical protein COA90_09170 [Gammaproteobacteria bacterium]|nr:MAG: hypothetical protein COA90_09170 [Gammaproteobacteria bacterium]
MQKNTQQYLPLNEALGTQGIIMRKILAIIFLIASFSVLASDDKLEAQYTIEILDGFCIQNQDDFNNIVPMAESAGGKALPNEQADPVMRELGGKTVFVPYKGRNYIVAFANGGGCTVITKNIDLVNLKKSLAKHFQTKLIDKQSSLAQVNEMLEVTAKGIYQGSIISLVYPQPDSGYTEGSVSFLPASVVNSAVK